MTQSDPEVIDEIKLASGIQGKKVEPFDMKMMALHARDKPFIKKGPQVIHGHMQRTQCQLLLDVSDDTQMQIFRADRDLYQQSYSFSDLPEAASANRDL